MVDPRPTFEELLNERVNQRRAPPRALGHAARAIFHRLSRQEEEANIPLAAAPAVRRTVETLSDAVVDAVFKISDFGEESASCGVCLESVWNIQWVVFPCKHFFCLRCVLNLITSIATPTDQPDETKRSCPICRRVGVLDDNSSFEVCRLSSAVGFELTVQTAHTNELATTPNYEFTQSADKFKLADLVPRFPRLPSALAPVEDLSNIPRAKRLKLTTLHNTTEVLERELIKSLNERLAANATIVECEAQITHLTSRIDENRMQKAALDEHILDLKATIALQNGQIKAIKDAAAVSTASGTDKK